MALGLEQLSLLIVGCLVPAWIVSAIVTAVMRSVAPRWGLIDRPAARKVHTTATPTGGGVGIWAGVVVPLLVGQIMLASLTVAPSVMPRPVPEQDTRTTQTADGETPASAPVLFGPWPVPGWIAEHVPGLWDRAGELWTLLAAATVFLVLGLLDDRFGLPWPLRLAIQFGLAAVCVAVTGWSLTLFLGVPLLAGTLSVIWIAGMINSFNMLDNMNGLSAGVAWIASAVLAAVMLVAPHPDTGGPQLFVAGFLLLLCGSLAGFLGHNLSGRIFMGDGGSYFVGFCMGMITLLATYTGYKSGTTHAILTPVFVLAVPLYDTTTVVVIRLRRGHSPFHADKNHVSHRLVDLGMSRPAAVRTVWLLTLTTGLLAFLLHRVDTVGAVVLTALLVCVLGLIAVLEVTARRTIRRHNESAAGVGDAAATGPSAATRALPTAPERPAV